MFFVENNNKIKNRNKHTCTHSEARLSQTPSKTTSSPHPAPRLSSTEGHQSGCVVSGAGPEAPAHHSSPVDHRHSGGDPATSPGGHAQPSDPATQPAGVPACVAGSIPLPGQAEEGLPHTAAGQVGGPSMVVDSFTSRVAGKFHRCHRQ